MGDNIFDIFPGINTARLDLREIQQEDTESIYKLLSIPEVIKHDSFELFTDIEQAEEVLESLKDEYKQQRAIFWGIHLKEQAELIGFCKCKLEIPKVRAGFGYSLRHDYWNMGIMTETLGSIIDFTFNTMDVNRIEATVATQNKASLRVLEKLGFIKEGVLRQRSCFRGRYHDMVMLSLLKAEHCVELYGRISELVQPKAEHRNFSRGFYPH